MATANPLNIQRTAFMTWTANIAATTITAPGVAIPAGALVTGIRMVSPDANTTTGGSATYKLLAGAEPLAATFYGKNLPTIGTIATTATLTAAGVLLATGGPLIIQGQASSSTHITGSWDVYVDYLYCADHEVA